MDVKVAQFDKTKEVYHIPLLLKSHVIKALRLCQQGDSAKDSLVFALFFIS